MNVSRYIFFTFLCNDRDWACSFRTLHTTSTSCFSRKSPMSSTNKYGKCFDIWRRLWYEKSIQAYGARMLQLKASFCLELLCNKLVLQRGSDGWESMTSSWLYNRGMYYTFIPFIDGGWLTSFAVSVPRLLSKFSETVRYQNQVISASVNKKIFWTILNSKYSMSSLSSVYWRDIFLGTVYISLLNL